MTRRLAAAWIGGLAMGVSGGVFVSELVVAVEEWEILVAGALASLAIWVTGIVMGLAAPTVSSAWRRLGSLTLCFTLGWLLVSR